MNVILPYVTSRPENHFHFNESLNAKLCELFKVEAKNSNIKHLI